MDFCVVIFPNFEGFDSVDSFEDMITPLRQCLAHGGAQERVVFDKQNGFIAAADGIRFGLLRLLHRLFSQARNVNAECRSEADFAVDVDPAVMLLDDAEDGGQSQAGAFADAFGAEERLENVREDFRRDAAAGVAHAQADERTWPCLRRLRTGEFVEINDGSFNDQAAAFGHGVAGIHHQIHQHLIHHDGVCMDDQRLQGEFELQLDVFAERALEHLGHAVDGLVQVQIAQLQRLFAAEQQQLVR